MDPTTIFLAKLAGPLILAVGLGIFLSRGHYQKIYRSLGNEPLASLMSGMIAVAAGIALILYHNRWDTLLAGIISLIGWLSIFKGLALIIVPETIDKIGNILVNSNWFRFTAVLYVVAGVYVSYIAYFV